MAKRHNMTIGEYFMFLHNNPPAPFNPDYDPKATERARQVTRSMEADDFYATHNREECKAEWGRRYDELKGVATNADT
jgi:hypothetical protein